MYDDEDGNLVILFINSIYSPNEFYVWFAKNGPKDIMEDYKDLIRRLKFVQIYQVFQASLWIFLQIGKIYR